MQSTAGSVAVMRRPANGSSSVNARQASTSRGEATARSTWTPCLSSPRSVRRKPPSVTDTPASTSFAGGGWNTGEVRKIATTATTTSVATTNFTAGRTKRSEVAPAGERLDDARPRKLVDGEPLAARGRERRDRPLRDLERVLRDPAPACEVGGRHWQV